MSDDPAPTSTNLLLALAGPGAVALRPHMTFSTLERGTFPYRRDTEERQLVFPLTAVISLVTRAGKDGGPVETGLIGREGCAGIEALLGPDTTLSDAVVQAPGDVLLAPVRLVRELFRADSQFRDAMLVFLRALLGQMMQTAACNRLHPVEARCARWLLMMQERTRRHELAITHEFLAEMLGVRRPTVTLVLQSLEQAGVISGARGRIAVCDRARLHGAACPCFDITAGMLAEVGLDPGSSAESDARGP